MKRYHLLLLLFCLIGARHPAPKSTAPSTLRLLSRLNGSWASGDRFNVRVEISPNRSDGGTIYAYSGKAKRPFMTNIFRVTGPDKFKDLVTGYTFQVCFTDKGRQEIMEWRVVAAKRTQARNRRFVRTKRPDPRETAPSVQPRR